MEVHVLEAAFKKNENERKALRVLKIINSPGLPKGENYLSNIIKLEVEVILGSGRKSRRRLILKKIPDELEKQKLVKEFGLFKYEITIYAQVLKEMEYLMDEFRDTNDPIWCSLLHFEPYTSFLMDDLGDKGFKVMNRKECLDLDHSLMAIRNLARFHAMSKILEERGTISENDFKPYALVNDPKNIKVMFHASIILLSEVIRKEWGPAWAKVSEKLNIPSEIFTEKMISIGKVDASKFNVLNHGDCWTANMMFKHDSEGKPIAYRLLDFQVSHYNSCAWDITYFIFTSVQASVRREHYDLLIESYYTSLKLNLSRYNYSNRFPELLEIYSEIDRISYFRLTVLMIHALTSADESEPFDLEKVMASNGTEGHYPSMYQNDKFKRNNGPELLDMVKKGII